MVDKVKRIDFGHAEIHAGDAFMAFVVDVTMADTEVITLSFMTPNTNKFSNMTIIWQSLAGGHLEVIEGVTLTQGSGAVVTVFNRNRNSSKITTLTENAGQVAQTSGIASGMTSSGGTTVKTRYLFGARLKGGGGSREQEEVILKKNTKYTIKYTADGNSNAGYIGLDWYEHTDDNPAS